MINFSEKTQSILKNIFYQLLILYTILILLSYLKFIPYFHYEYLAVIISLIGIFSIKNNKTININKALIIIPLLFILIIRIIPYLKFNIPLGFDAGIYKYLFEHFGSTETFSEPKGLYVLTSILLLFNNTEFLLKYFIIFLELLTGFFIFLVARKYFNKEAGFLSLLIYSISVTQFKAFTLMYYKNILAILFLLIILYYYENNFIFVITAALLSGTHTPIFLIFMLSYFICSINNLKKYLPRLILIAILGSPFYLTNLKLLEPIKNIENIGAGNFITLETYLFFSLSYLIFSMLGVFKGIKEKKINLLTTLLVINSIIVIFKLFFFNRYIISLDILLILFSGYGLYLLLSDKRILSIVLSSLLLLSSMFFIINEAIKIQPEITKEKLDEIISLPDGKILTERKYAPWILAYKEAVIAPSLFGDDSSKPEWENLFSGKNYSLLEKYKPDYIYLDNDLNHPCVHKKDYYYYYQC